MIVILILGALVAFSDYPLASEPLTSARASVLIVALGTAVASGLAFVLLWAALGRTPADASQLKVCLARSRRGVILYHGFLLGEFAFCVYGARWPDVVRTAMGLAHIPLADEILIFLPFAVPLLVSMIPLYRIDALLAGRTGTLAQYMSYQLRRWVTVLLPGGTFMLGNDMVELVGGAKPESASLVWSVVFVCGLAISFPLVLRWTLGMRSLPAGSLRESLEQICGEAKLRFKNILMVQTWGHVPNAGVMGIIPMVRYVFLTDGLLGRLSRPEIEAVFRHEAAHVRCRHIPYYAMLAVGFAGLASSLWSLFPESVERNIYLDTAFFLGFAGIYWGGLFGYISRRFELEADVHAARGAEGPVHLIAALEKIALFGRHARSSRSWRHFSVAKRVEFLAAAWQDPKILAGFGKLLARLRMLILALAASGLVSLALTFLRG